MVFSDNGIIKKAQEAANKMNEAIINDQESIKELTDYMANMLNTITEETIPENTTGPNGKPLVEKLTEIQTSNNVEAEDKYGNPITVPKGFKVVVSEATTIPEGIVIEDRDGNQFVWIPVGVVHKDNNPENDVVIQLGRYTFDTTTGEAMPVQLAYTEKNPTNYMEEIPIENETDDYSIELDEAREGTIDNNNHLNDLNATAKNLAGFVQSVKDNSGYYLARYEASYGSGSSVSDWKPLSKVSTETPRGDNQSSTTLTQGMLWNWVTQLDASKICQNMYKDDNTVGVESDLVNSYAWDTAILFIQEIDEANSNYSNKTDENGILKNTGTTNDKACNIYDMGANLLEWITEYSCFKTVDRAYPCTHRGAQYNTVGYYTTAKRNVHLSEITNSLGYIGFRTLLYAK